MAAFDPTPEQQQILNHSAHIHGRILAGPGSGKSTTIVALIDRLLSVEAPPRIRLLTFTRAATGELAQKVSAHPTAAIERPSTIHSFAISVLLQNPIAGGLPQPLRIADKAEEQNIVHKTLARLLNIRVTMLRRLLREMAANWESLGGDTDPIVDTALRPRFTGAWQQHREVFGYTLLSELPFRLRSVLRDHPDVDGIEYDLLIVDEYQDLNACDLEVLRLVSDRGCRIFAVGDDDQSIYLFRKAHPEGIRRFPADYPGSADYRLSVTKRCGQQIVQWAKHVIIGDPDRPAKVPELTAPPEAPAGEVALLSFPREVSEARGLALLAQQLIDSEGLEPSEILILLRSDHNNAFSDPIKQELARLDIPFSDPSTVDNILLMPDTRQVISEFRLLVNDCDSLAWATLLQLERGVSDEFSQYIYQSAANARRQLGETLLTLRDQEFPDGPSHSSMRAARLIDRTRDLLRRLAIPQDVPEDGWGHWICEVAALEGELSIPESLHELFEIVDTQIEPAQELGQYLGQIGPIGRDIESAKSDGVRVMTMTGSKGLTVRASIVAAAEDGLTPRHDADLGEERRLMYVAMTRAREYLFCTWARRRQGPTARAGLPNVQRMRRHSSFFDGGPVESEDGDEYIRRRIR